jgi:hypothetical protein
VSNPSVLGREWCFATASRVITRDFRVRTAHSIFDTWAGANEPFALENSFYGRQQFLGGIRFDNVSLCTSPQCSFYDIGITMYACEEDFDLRKQFSDGPSSLDSAELRKADVHKDQVWLRSSAFWTACSPSDA